MDIPVIVLIYLTAAIMKLLCLGYCSISCTFLCLTIIQVKEPLELYFLLLVMFVI